MGYLRINEVVKSKNSIFRVKLVMKKLMRRVELSIFRRELEDDYGDHTTSKVVDGYGYMGYDNRVVEGHFPVLTIGGDQPPKKFFVGLRYLNHPAFVKLLEDRERELGFDQQGVLVVPCQASELQSILAWV
ncbi:hypothetical protein MKW94_015491 [Papaver nudicaule]|uniref:Uncharacterized protein n=1 Tax=Papaver nudicaule TaxID=74823 RepID=A0AA41V8I0_PAPNU|nr:hypothetical protein [Papaver nudicaule]